MHEREGLVALGIESLFSATNLDPQRQHYKCMVDEEDLGSLQPCG